MNDNQITDDLLEELEQLENSAEALEKQVNHSQEKQKAFEKLDSASNIDATSLALEAAKTSQEAAFQSQKAAETSIKHANRQKAQIIELTDANFSWRQAVKTANHELKAARSSFTIMLIISIVMGAVSMSVVGWLLYSMNKKENLFKGEVLDIIQTENALHNKQITIKVDEISSLLELLTAEIKRISPTHKQHTQVEPTSPTPVENDSMQAEDSPSENVIDLQQEAVSAAPQETPTEEVAIKPAVVSENKPATLVIDETQYKELKSLIERILSEQQALQAKAMVTGEVTSSALSASQAQQLKDIIYLVKSQSKTLKKIQTDLSKQPLASQTNQQVETSVKQAQQNYQQIQKSLSELKAQLNTLKNQQNSLQEQVKTLQAETEKLAAEPKPYSYRIPK